MTTGAFKKALVAEVDAAWRSMAIRSLRQDRFGMWASDESWMPSEEAIKAREAELERASFSEPEPCGCDESKALRVRLARLEGGA